MVTLQKWSAGKEVGAGGVLGREIEGQGTGWAGRGRGRAAWMRMTLIKHEPLDIRGTTPGLSS